jgi:hypothetical protein
MGERPLRDLLKKELKLPSGCRYYQMMDQLVNFSEIIKKFLGKKIRIGRLFQI